MKQLIFVVFFTLLGFIGCSKPAPLSCCNLVNIYQTFEYPECSIPKPLDVARGYERIAKIVLIDQFTQEFQDKVKLYLDHMYYSQEVHNPYIHKYCREVNNIVRSTESNLTRRDIQLRGLEVAWVKAYKNKLNQDLKGKLKFNRLDGCEKEAESFERVLFDQKGVQEQSHEHYLDIKRIYEDCLFNANERKKQKEIDKLNKQLQGEQR